MSERSNRFGVEATHRPVKMRRPKPVAEHMATEVNDRPKYRWLARLMTLDDAEAGHAMFGDV